MEKKQTAVTNVYKKGAEPDADELLERWLLIVNGAGTEESPAEREPEGRRE